MKQILILMLLCALLTGCAPTAASHTTVPTSTPPESQSPTESTYGPAEALHGEKVFVTKVSYTLYLPDGNAEDFLQINIEADQIHAGSILATLQEHNVLPETVILNAFASEGNHLILDFNQAFADLVCSSGTSGERMIIGSVVNTFLNAFQAESISFTVEGEILESGHVIYDFPITFIE